jgi:hypothetical protein
MAFAGCSDLGLADEEGRTHFCSYRKVPSQASTAYSWCDLSMAAGNPLPQYYAASPLEAARLEGFRGLFHGDDKAPSTMHLVDWSVTTPTANCVGHLKLLRYGLYYPFIDGDSLDQQDLTNDVAALNPPASGWRVMAVAVAPTIGGGSFTYTYVRNGVTKTSPTITVNTAVTNIASIVTAAPAVAAGGQPFLPMAHGDTGVDYITSVTFLGAAGGLIALVLVDPIADLAAREINTPAEKSWPMLSPGAPRIYDDDYLGFIVCPTGSVAAGIYTGHMNFAWSR